MSKLKLMTVRFSPQEGFVDGILEEFQEGKEILSYAQHFFMEQGTPYLLLILNYREEEALHREEENRPKRAMTSKKAAHEDWTKDLDHSERERYERVRKWRAIQAEKDGIPRYIIVTNRVLADIVKKNPATMAELGKIPDLSAMPFEKYGEAILACLAGKEVEVSIGDTQKKTNK